MKFVITGSLGHISKPVVKELAAAGHDVTVITSDNSKADAISGLGAKAAVGSVKDAEFLTESFKGADAIYLMIPNDFGASSYLDHARSVADNYVSAVKNAGIRNVVQLSSIGAHMRKGAGQIDGLGYLESELEKLDEVNVLMLRPSYFYYNFYNMTGMIKGAGIMGSNFGNETQGFPMTHTDDIATEVIRGLLDTNAKGHRVHYIISDERTTTDIASVFGKAIGKPDLQWIRFSDEDSRQGMLQSGLNADATEGYIEMGHAFQGEALEDYLQNKPERRGNVKLEDFAKEFAAGYANS